MSRDSVTHLCRLQDVVAEQLAELSVLVVHENSVTIFVHETSVTVCTCGMCYNSLIRDALQF